MRRKKQRKRERRPKNEMQKPMHPLAMKMLGLALGLKQYPPVVSISFIILAEKQAAKSAKSMESNF